MPVAARRATKQVYAVLTAPLGPVPVIGLSSGRRRLVGQRLPHAMDPGNSSHVATELAGTEEVRNLSHTTSDPVMQAATFGLLMSVAPPPDLGSGGPTTL